MIYVYYTYNPTFQSSQAKLLARPNSVPSCLKHRAKANQRQRCNTTASAPHSFVQLVGGTENSPETRWERPFCQASSPREAWHEIALSELETPQLWLILDYDGLSWINCDGLWWNYGLQWIIYIYIGICHSKNLAAAMDQSQISALIFARCLFGQCPAPILHWVEGIQQCLRWKSHGMMSSWALHQHENQKQY